MQLNQGELQLMLQRRGFDSDLSFGAFEKDKLVAFTLNGIDSYQGVSTAYDTGTGTIENYRGQGLASRVFTFSLPFLQKAGIENYLLEVLQHNSKAISVYKKLGFTISREFNYFVQEQEKLNLKLKPLDPSYRIQALGLDREEAVRGFWDFIPSWQNDFAAIRRKGGTFKMLGAYQSNKLVGYCILETQSGDITQIAVDRQHRRKGIASHLLSQILSFNQHASVKVINTEIRCKSITQFLETRSISLKGKQFEMVKRLAP
jgi:ribosomal protein S18 acetylase RimI-like enzyme